MFNKGVVLVVVFAFIFQVLLSAAPADSLKVLTLDDCIKLAVTKSTEVLKGNNNLAIAGVEVMGSYGQFLPDLTAGAGYNYTAGKDEFLSGTPLLVNGNKSGYNYQLVSSINIFNGFADKASLKAALLQKNGQQFSLQRVLQQISFDVIQAYLQVILDRRIAAYAKDNLTTSVKREAQLKELTEVGRKVKSDLYQQQAQTSQDKLILLNAENKLRTDKINLFKKLRIADAEHYELADLALSEEQLSSGYANEQSLIDTALVRRADLEAGKLAMDVAEQNLEKYRSGYLPKVGFNYGVYSTGGYYYRLSLNDVPALPPTQTAFGTQLGQVYGIAGLNATWNIFDKNVTRTNVSLGKIALDNARIDYEDLQIGIKTDIKQALGDYTSAVQQVETSDKGIVAAQGAFEIIKGRYDLGSATFIELVNAQLNLLQAQENKTQSVIGLMLQERIIAFYIGKS